MGGRKGIFGLPVCLLVFCVVWTGIPAMAGAAEALPTADVTAHAASGEAETPEQPGQDIAAASVVTDAAAPVEWLASLRRFAVVVFLAALTVAGLAYAAGSRGLAFGVLGGAFFLYAGYWIVVLLVSPLAPAAVPTENPGLRAGPVQPGAGPVSNAAQVVRSILNTGLELLSLAVAPFVMVYAALLGLKAAQSGGLEPGEFAAFVIGTFVIFGAGSVGAMLNVLPANFWN